MNGPNRRIECGARPRRGFTLVELLVVIAIIGLLIALLLPAVQAAREAARRLQCKNHLKQLALACLNYHETYGHFPPGGQWPSYIPQQTLNTTIQFGPNWCILILPFVEQQSLYDSFDFDKVISAPINRPARATRLSVMRCPSDVRDPGHYDGLQQREFDGENWARGNYAANAANGGLGGALRYESWAMGPDAPAWLNFKRRGVMGPSVSVRIAEITDGTSNTLLLSEIRTGLTKSDRRGTWAMSGVASALYWHGWSEGVIGPANGPNDCSPNSDDIPGCLRVLHDLGSKGVEILTQECMTCNASRGKEGQAGTRSRHPGGVHSAFADGSVHRISDSIETRRHCCSVWDRLILSADELPIDGGDVGL